MSSTQATTPKRFADLEEAQKLEVVKNGVRYMLATNVSKKPVKQADLRAYMLKSVAHPKSDARMFDDAFQAMQEEMRGTFGMEVREISKPLRSKQPSGSQKKPAQSKAYILVSVLDPEHRPEPDKDTCALMGFITVVAAMILLEPGCRVEEKKLYFHLKRIGVHVRQRSGHQQLNDGNVKELLEKKLIEQCYFGREIEDDNTFYTLGPRLRAELDDEDLISFVDAVYVMGNNANTSGGLDEATVNLLKRRLNESATTTGNGSK